LVRIAWARYRCLCVIEIIASPKFIGCLFDSVYALLWEIYTEGIGLEVVCQWLLETAMATSTRYLGSSTSIIIISLMERIFKTGTLIKIAYVSPHVVRRIAGHFCCHLRINFETSRTPEMLCVVACRKLYLELPCRRWPRSTAHELQRSNDSTITVVSESGHSIQRVQNL
jgi:hypothetical protein